MIFSHCTGEIVDIEHTFAHLLCITTNLKKIYKMCTFPYLPIEHDCLPEIECLQSGGDIKLVPKLVSHCAIIILTGKGSLLYP